ncbi:TRAP transporter small permease [Yoonia sediminilitoris]|uniref:TRAP transporter small permease protein n=1 Tax=Yoonia sediminilitoris TaxID=1286148 RepID=A0A2T6KR28_9RHOB|nr:TRAP transporter small permease [Yoonia sediminilitoris]PUB19021.1 TRAP-type C4-dicarboxylate transport system permease small subunit [Yoonia sediminilitoris]RCW99189.1 TRAP-type C4-dicarboxylate transport system permease small subunit [Yoonia sediminilitoris]
MLHKVIDRLARVMAALGGLVLCALVLIVCISIAGREINSVAHSGALGGFGAWLLSVGLGPINGDFELVEAGIAFAIFAFLPLTQLTGSHATVDIFTNRLGPSVLHVLESFWAVVMAVVMILITWRLFAGMHDKMRYGETTYLIQFPIWWAYAASFCAAVTACIVSIYCAVMRIAGKSP